MKTLNVIIIHYLLEVTRKRDFLKVLKRTFQNFKKMSSQYYMHKACSKHQPYYVVIRYERAKQFYEGKIK